LKNLRKLNLRNNQLTDLPPCVSNLHQLTELDLRDNRLTSFPVEAVSNLLHLQKLDLRWNAISSGTNWVPELESRGCIVYI